MAPSHPAGPHLLDADAKSSSSRTTRPTATPEVRLLSLTQYPYRIYYTVTAVAVVILHIRHSARLGPDLGTLGH
jgi:hypothetical protein